MPPIRGSDFSKATGAQAFIDSMLIGENLRRAKTEAAQNETLGQQSIDLNNQSKDINALNLESGTFNLEQARLQAELDQAARQQAEFEALQEKKRNIAQGLEVLSQGGFITDPKDPTRTNKIPISPTGNLTAETARGPVSVSTDEAKQIREVEGRKRQIELQRKKEDSVASSAGSLESAKQKAEYDRIAEERKAQLEQEQAQRNQEHALALIEKRGEVDKRLESHKAYLKAKYGTGETADYQAVDNWVRNIGTGQATLTNIKDQKTREAVQEELHRRGWQIFDKTRVNKAIDLVHMLEPARQAIDEAVGIYDRSNPLFTQAKGIIPLTDENYIKEKLNAVKPALATLAGEVGRKTEGDIDRVAGMTPEAGGLSRHNHLKRDQFYVNGGNALKIRFNNAPDEQILAIMPEAAPYLDAYNQQAEQSAAATVTEQALNQPKTIEQIRQDILNDPGWIADIEREGSTVEKEAKLLFDGQNPANKSKKSTATTPNSGAF